MTNQSDLPVVHILHDNEEWLPPLRRGLSDRGVPFTEWDLSGGSIDLSSEPPAGVFWSRLSASAHTRGQVHARDYARSVLNWLEAAGRRVVNGSSVLDLEVSKVAQYSALRADGFDVPHTIVIFGATDPRPRARELALPFITKHNQGGKGLGVERFDTYEAFDAAVESTEPGNAPVDGILLLQEYVQTAAPFITRAEFVGGRFVYAVRVDTSAGSFELCPAEACVIPSDADSEDTVQVVGLAPAACDVGAAPGLFRERTEITAAHPLIVRLEAFLAARRIEVAGVEFFDTTDGRLVPYDINTNTNYNPDVESANGHRAVTALAEFLEAELDRASVKPNSQGVFA